MRIETGFQYHFGKGAVSVDTEQFDAFHKLTHAMQIMTLEYRDDEAMLVPNQRTNASLIYLPERTAYSNKLTI